MTALSESFFSWTSRRVDLTAIDKASSVTPELDEPLRCGNHQARLIAMRDADTDVEYLALVVGDVSGRSDITVREVDEELLLVEGSRSPVEQEILLGVSSEYEEGYSGTDHLDREVCVDGPVRSMIAWSGARSVIVDWYHGSPSRSSPQMCLPRGVDSRTAGDVRSCCGDGVVEGSRAEAGRMGPGEAPSLPHGSSVRGHRRVLSALRFGISWAVGEEPPCAASGGA